MNANVSIYDALGNDPIGIDGVTSLSFIDNETHGPSKIFGITETATNGRFLIVSSPNVTAVEVMP